MNQKRRPPAAMDPKWIALGVLSVMLLVAVGSQVLFPPAAGTKKTPPKRDSGVVAELDPSMFPGPSTAEPAGTSGPGKGFSRRSEARHELDPEKFYPVAKVADGDTLEVSDDGRTHRIRLFGVDTPETKQAYGPEAKAFTVAFLADKKARVVVKDVDQYGRLVAQVFREDGKSLNEALVENGCAWWYRQYDKKNATLDRLETAARDGKIGLWAAPDPTPPWVWRSKNRRED